VAATGRHHVITRSFLLENRRAKLPKAPACRRYRFTGEVAARRRGGSKVRALVDERDWVLERHRLEPLLPSIQ
jgi:hypothetical protein